MAEPAKRKEAPVQTGLSTFAFCVLAVSIAIFLGIGWFTGFSSGARQATDQILAHQTQSTDVVVLQAQLDEQRRAEDRISNTLLAAFTAGAAVLVVLNFATYFIVQQRLQEERRGLQEDLIRDAKLVI